MDLQPHELGVILPVKAQPGAKQNAIRGEREGALCVAVTQIAEKGKANKALIDVIAKGLGLKRSQIELLSGETSSQKKFLITGVSIEELTTLVTAAVVKHS